jgi:hypothetical protein
MKYAFAWYPLMFDTIIIEDCEVVVRKQKTNKVAKQM